MSGLAGIPKRHFGGFILAVTLVSGGLLITKWVNSPDSCISNYATPAKGWVRVTSGDPVVPPGRMVTLSACIMPHEQIATLEIWWASGAFQQLPMEHDGRGTHFLSIPAQESFTYRVTSAGVNSERHHVSTIEPITLLPASTIVIHPPGYASDVIRTSVVEINKPVTALENSTAHLQLVFSRPVKDVFAHWLESDSEAAPKSLELRLAASREQADLCLNLTRSGCIRITTVAVDDNRHFSYRTDIPVEIVPDTPPRFVAISGIPLRGGQIRPGTTLRIACEAVDDVKPGQFILEYRRGNTDRVETRRFGVREGRHIAGMLVQALPTDLREGEVLHIRLRLSDERPVTSTQLRPQESFLPSSGWIPLQVSESAPPLELQEIEQQSEAWGKTLSQVSATLKDVFTDVETVFREGNNSQTLSTDQIILLQNGHDRCRALNQWVNEFCQSAELAADLRFLSVTLHEKMRLFLKDISNSLSQATMKSPDKRNEALHQARSCLQQALQHTQQFQQDVRFVTQLRRDRFALMSLAAEQEILFERLGKNELSPAEAATVQQSLASRLKQHLHQSPLLREALSQLLALEVQHIHDSLCQLLMRQRELAEAIIWIRATELSAVRNALMQQQRQLAERWRQESHRLELGLRLTHQPELKPDHIEKIADRTQLFDTLDVLVEQERLAGILDQAAKAFSRWDEERHDAKLALRQVIAWQSDLQKRLLETLQHSQNSGFSPLLRFAWAEEQSAIRDALRQLRIPKEMELLVAQFERCLAAMSRSHRCLLENPAQASEIIEDIVQLLTVVHDHFPSKSERLSRSRGEFDRIRQAQESINLQAEVILRSLGEISSPKFELEIQQKLKDLVERQRSAAQRLANLDLPSLEYRQAAVAWCMQVAVETFQMQWIEDIPPVLLRLKNSLEWLRQSWDRLPVLDEAVAEITQQQASLAEEIRLSFTKGSTSQLDKWAAEQRRLLQILKQINSHAFASDSPTLWEEALAALRQSEAALREGHSFDQLISASQQAARVLEQLHRSLRGEEASWEVVTRLARRRSNSTNATHNPPGLDRERIKREVMELQQLPVGRASDEKREVLKLYAELIAEKNDSRKVLVALEKLATTLKIQGPQAEFTLQHFRKEVACTTETYLPWKRMAGILQDLAQQQRRLRDETIQSPMNISQRLRPISDQQWCFDIQMCLCRASELLSRTEELVVTSPSSTCDSLFSENAIENIRQIERYLQVGRVVAAREQAQKTRRYLCSQGELALRLKGDFEVLVACIECLSEEAGHVIFWQKVLQEQLLRECNKIQSQVYEITDKSKELINDSDQLCQQLRSPITHLGLLLKEVEKQMEEIGRKIESDAKNLSEDQFQTLIALLTKSRSLLNKPVESRSQLPENLIQAARNIQDLHHAMEDQILKLIHPQNDYASDSENVGARLKIAWDRALQQINQAIKSHNRTVEVGLSH